jgi:hypothetical protein
MNERVDGIVNFIWIDVHCRTASKKDKIFKADGENHVTAMEHQKQETR